MPSLIENHTNGTRSLRRITLLLARVTEDAGSATAGLRRLEPLLHRIERRLACGAPLERADVERLIGAGDELARLPVRGPAAIEALRRDLASELHELAELLNAARSRN